MTIIFFHGLGCSKKSINYIYNGKIYNKNNFIKLLEKNRYCIYSRNSIC